MEELQESPHPNARKRSEIEKEQDILLEVKMYLEGLTLREIVDKMSQLRDYSLSLEQIRLDIKKAREGWQAESKELIGEHIFLQLAKLDKLEYSLWQEWEQSGGNIEIVTKRTNGEVYGNIVMEEITKTERKGRDMTYANGILNCIDKRAKLLGLYSETLKITPDNNEDNKGFVFNLVVPAGASPAEGAANG
jgi:hypothetical protein